MVGSAKHKKGKQKKKVEDFGKDPNRFLNKNFHITNEDQSIKPWVVNEQGYVMYQAK